MKKALTIVLSVLMLVFCVSCSDKEANSVEKSDALIDYITVYSSDGQLEGYLEYEYDNDGKLITNGMQDNNHAWIWFYVNEYDQDGHKTKMIQYDERGKELVTFSYETDEKGNVIKEAISYSDDSLMEQSSTFEYDGDKLYKVTHQDNSYYTYEYDKNGNQVKEFYYTADGELVRTYQSKYDKNGNLIKTSFIDGDGTTGSYSTYEYNNKGETTFSYDYDENGSLINKMEYHYLEK